MAGGTRCAMQCGYVTGAAGCMAVIHTKAAFICNARMRAIIRSRPVTGVMTRGTIRTEYSCMVSRVSVTGDASRGRACKLPAHMTALAGQAGMTARQRESAQTMIERGSLPGIC